LDKESEKLVIELMKRGATLLQEPCPKCGGIMLRYKGKEYCPVDSQAKSIQQLEELSKPVAESLNETLQVARAKLKELTNELEEGKDASRTSALLSEMNSLVDLIDRLEKKLEKRG
jgi:UPF0148 protein